MTEAVQIDDLVVSLAGPLAGERIGVDNRLHQAIADHVRVRRDQVTGYTIERRSLDARRKPDLVFRYRLQANLADGSAPQEGPGVQVLTDPPNQEDPLYHLPLSDQRPREVLVVGTGPAGLMAAYLLALHGTKVVVLDRGRDVARRHDDIERFRASRDLNPESNYLYGEGGAGTYSDGKLYTRAKDRRMRFLLEAFVSARAPRDCLYTHHPHVGSDILPHMVRRLREQIIAWGGSFRWDAEVVDLIRSTDHDQPRCQGVVLATGERLTADATLLAPGHSARRLITRLCELGIEHKAKGFQLGCRIEHDQRLINLAQLGCEAPPRYLLPAAEYNLVNRPPRDRRVEGVTTFCMCPGGEIITATCDPGQLSTNGMSPHHRRGHWANAGLICNQPVDRSGDGLAGFAAIERIERAAFAAGGSDYTCPGQAATAFLRGEAGPPPPSGSYHLGQVPGRLDELLPRATVDALRAALRRFERIIPGFLRHGRLVGVETRVSSPVRFERNPETLASSLPDCYLAGEGAGYAGGIVSAALDGIRLAETMLTGQPARREKRMPAAT